MVKKTTSWLLDLVSSDRGGVCEIFSSVKLTIRDGSQRFVCLNRSRKSSSTPHFIVWQAVGRPGYVILHGCCCNPTGYIDRMMGTRSRGSYRQVRDSFDSRVASFSSMINEYWPSNVYTSKETNQHRVEGQDVRDPTWVYDT